MSKTPRKTPRKAVAERVGADQPPQADFEEVVSLIETARTRALAAVNTVLIDLYWQIGEYISHKIAAEGWGKGTVGTLAEYIQRRQPGRTGFSASNLWRMRQFFDTYRDAPKLAALLRELSWSHNLAIMSRCKREEEREFYPRVCIREKWGKRELQRQLDSALFERTVLSPVKLSPVVTELRPPPKSPQAVAKSSALRKVPQAAAQLTDSILWAIPDAQARGTGVHMGPARVDSLCLHVFVSRFFS